MPTKCAINSGIWKCYSKSMRLFKSSRGHRSIMSKGIIGVPEFTLIRQAVEEFVQKDMAGQDGSHDYAHVERVRSLALEIASKEGTADMQIVEIGALMHDVKDHKYCKAGEDGQSAVQEFLGSLGGCSKEFIDSVGEVVGNVSYSKEVKRGGILPMTPELACVQDADRLDAIGAVGIARCFTFGGSRNRSMYGGPESSLEHFDDKLFKIRKMMKTSTGKTLAAQRHEFMKLFYDQFKTEAGL